MTILRSAAQLLCLLSAMRNLLAEFGTTRLVAGDELHKQLVERHRADLDELKERIGFSVTNPPMKEGIKCDCFEDLLPLGEDSLPKFSEFIQEKWGFSTAPLLATRDELVRFLWGLARRNMKGVTPQIPESFNARRYLKMYPDVATAEVDPKDHFCKHGYFEARLH